jgi:hypothetical protein
MIVAKRDDDACWLDQLEVVSGPRSAFESSKQARDRRWSRRLPAM